MNDNAKKWVEALRSGEYEQGRQALRTGDTYCCLGVACDLYAKEHPEARWVDDLYETSQHFDDGAGGRASVILPSSVQDWLGLAEPGGALEHAANPQYLTGLNDGTSCRNPYMFAEIADVIESEPEGLFVS